MKNSNIFPDEYIPAVKPSEIEKTVDIGKRYISSHRPRKTPLSRIFLDQLKYLSPAIWILQLTALAAANYFCGQLNVNNGFRMMLAVIPIISIVNVPELVKDMLFDMSELERSTRIGSGTVMLMRLLIISITDIFVLSFAALMASGMLGKEFFQILLFTLTVYNAENAVCLGIVRLFGMRSRNSVVCLCAAVSLMTIMLAAIVNNDSFSAVSENMLLLALAAVVTALAFAAQIIFMTKKTYFGGLSNEN